MSHQERFNGASLEVTEVSFSDLLVPQLVGDATKAKAKLNAFVAQLDLLPYLEAEPSQHFNWPGHPTLICKIRAGIWQTERLRETKDGRLTFPDPSQHFDVHFELQVLQRTSHMALYLHYETNPYFSAAKLRSRADGGSLEQYYDLRNDFVREFTALGEVPGFRLSPGIVQIGKAEYDFSGKTVAEVAAWLQPVIDEVACRVNEAFFNVEIRRRIVAQSPTNDFRFRQ